MAESIDTQDQWTATVQDVDFRFTSGYDQETEDSVFHVATGDKTFTMKMECVNCNFEFQERERVPDTILKLEGALSDHIQHHYD